jgi:hypothetical protein
MDFSHLNSGCAVTLAAAFLLVAAATPVAVHAQTDDSASALTDDTSEPTTPDWDRIDDPAPDSSGQVLELPQVVTLDESSVDATPSDAASVGETTDDSAVDMASRDDTAAIPSGDEADYLDDYANRLTAGRALALSPRPAPYYPAVGRWRFITIPPANVIIARPSGLGGIPATSPLLTTPRGSGPIFGGWWHRVH